MSYIETAPQGFRLARGTAQTATALGTAYVTVTDPTTGDGVFKGEQGKSLVIIQPFAAMADNGTFTGRINAIRKVSGTTDTWMRTPIVAYTGTASTAVGVAGGLIGTASRFADQIAKTYGASTVEVIEPGNNIPGYIVADIGGAEAVEFEFTGTAVNALVSFI